MIKGRHPFLAFPILAALTGLAAAGPPAIAQPTGKEIVVESPQVVRETIGRSSIGVRDELVSLSHRIVYSDLDLTKAADVEKLNARVREAAELGCRQIHQIYPLADRNPNCVRQAVERATPQIRAAIGRP